MSNDKNAFSKYTKVNESIAPEPFAAFFGTLLYANLFTKMNHLETYSVSQHTVLGSFYGGLEDLTDSLIEAYQGANRNRVKGYTCSVAYNENPVFFIESLKNYILKEKVQLFPQMPQNTNMLNIIDEIVTLIDSTLYKLSFNVV